MQGNDSYPFRMSLHQLSLMEVQPEELVEIAAELKLDHACFFVNSPAFVEPRPMIRDVVHARSVKSRLDDSGLSAFNCDAAILTPSTAVEEYKEFIEIAATLGGHTINVISRHPDRVAAAALLAELAELVASHGMRTIVEAFRFSEIQTVDQACDLVRLAGHDHLGLNVDVLHLMRNGRRPSDLTAIDPALRIYAQISDGPLELPVDLQYQEAMSSRIEPGRGEFPLIDFVRQLPRTAVLAVETPEAGLKKAGLTPREQAARLVGSTRTIVQSALGLPH